MNKFISIILTSFLLTTGISHAETWRGLEVAAENRCSPYNRSRDYSYPQSIELEIIKELGGIYSPYTLETFESRYKTDIEHIVATSEAHDSGLCAQDRKVKEKFARDLRNLTLASPSLNRYQKRGKDASEWVPEHNKCWFANRVIEVRQAYNLTIDVNEVIALDNILAECEVEEETPSESDCQDALACYDDNKNGRITCKEARNHGIAPVHNNHPAYEFMRDGDGDGVVCE